MQGATLDWDRLIYWFVLISVYCQEVGGWIEQMQSASLVQHLYDLLKPILSEQSLNCEIQVWLKVLLSYHTIRYVAAWASHEEER